MIIYISCKLTRISLISFDRYDTINNSAKNGGGKLWRIR